MFKVYRNAVYLLAVSALVFIFWLGDGQLNLPTVIKPISVVPPKQLDPIDGAVLTNFPRKIVFRWLPVGGLTGPLYDLEIDCLHCTRIGFWDSEGGTSVILSNLSKTEAEYVFPGDNQGRWRVRVRSGNLVSVWSNWWYFKFKTVSQSNGKPNICINGLLRIGNKVTPWGSNYTLTLNPQDAAVVGGGKARFPLNYLVKNCAGSAPPTFKNQIYFDNLLVSENEIDGLGPVGSNRSIQCFVVLPLKNGILKIKLDSTNIVPEDWENDNEVWVNIVFSGFK